VAQKSKELKDFADLLLQPADDCCYLGLVWNDTPFRVLQVEIWYLFKYRRQFFVWYKL